jgi:hypothetical protein
VLTALYAENRALFLFRCYPPHHRSSTAQ